MTCDVQNSESRISKRYLLTVALATTTDDCIEWLGYRCPQGYGRVWIDGKYTGAHRAAWEQFNGPIPIGLCVLHRCDNPPCINPRHLFVGTHQDNMADRDRKGRARGGRAKARAKLTPAAVHEIRRALAEGVTGRELAHRYHLSKNAISEVKRGLTWSDV